MQLSDKPLELLLCSQPRQIRLHRTLSGLIENASIGFGEDIWHAMAIGPGVQQQFKFTLGVLST